MPTGTVLWFNTAKGFGYISPDEGDLDIRVYATAVARAGLAPLQDEQRVAYELERDPLTGQKVAGRLKLV